VKYSPIAPIALLQDLHQHKLLGDYHLVLAHDILEHQDAYRELFRELRQKYSELFVILDNSTIELGKPMKVRDLLVAAHVVDADCIVIPDVLGKAKETVEAAWDFWKDYKRHENLPLMAVPQGKTVIEHVLCSRLLRQVPLVDYWGVPRNLANRFGTRQDSLLMQELGYGDKYNGVDNVHMLGMSKHFEDDIKCAKLSGVMGIDSANPCVLGQDNILLSKVSNPPHLQRGDYWTQTHHTLETRDNIQFVRDALNGM